MSSLMDALGTIGYVADTPGAYLRGALAGNLGTRSSGRDLLSAYGLTDESDPLGDLKGFGAEMVLDPLSLAGPVLGAYKGLRGASKLGGLASEGEKLGSQLGSVSRFLASESGAMNPEAMLDALNSWRNGASSSLAVTPNLYHFSGNLGDAANNVASEAARLFGNKSEKVQDAVSRTARDYLDAASASASEYGSLPTEAIKQQGLYQNLLIDPLASRLKGDPKGMLSSLGEPILDAFKGMYKDAAYKDPGTGWVEDALSRLPSDPILNYKVARDVFRDMPKILDRNLGTVTAGYDRAREFLQLPEVPRYQVSQARALTDDWAKVASQNLLEHPGQWDSGYARVHLQDLVRNEGHIGRTLIPGLYGGFGGHTANIGQPARSALERSLGEIGSSDLNLLREALAAEYVPARTQGAVRRAVRQFSTGSGTLPREEAENLATKFFRMPGIPGTLEGADQAAAFDTQIRAGEHAAQAYFGPIYHDVNKHLRTLGNVGAPSEIDSIRKAVESGPTGLAGLSLPPPQPSALADRKIREVRPVISGLSDLLEHSALPADMNLFRGIDAKGLKKIEKALGVKLSEPSAIGKQFTDPAFMSTAFDKSTADAFAGIEPGYNRPGQGVTFDFGQVPAGRPASFMNASENEVLFPPGRTIRIDDNKNYPTINATLWSAILAALMAGNSMRSPDTSTTLLSGEG